MLKIKHLLASAALIITACGPKTVMPKSVEALTSPDGKLEAQFLLYEDGTPAYKLYYDGKTVIKPSKLGYKLVGGTDLLKGFTLEGTLYNTIDETWEPVWGEEKEIRNHCNEMLVILKREDGVAMNVRFRLYNDGLGFRYEFPMENRLTYFKVADEITQFALTGDHTAWWIAGDYDTQEYNYTRSRLSEIRKYNAQERPYNASQTVASATSVQTALQMKTDDGLYVNIHEAEVLDYPTANLDLDDKTFTFSTLLTPDAEGVKGRLQAPCHSPWRTVQVCEKATDVLASRLILNLNEPCALDDVSWIHPTKYMGVWWEMITGRTHWSYTSDFPSVQLGVTDYAKAKPHGHHGANNENVRMYIDFAAENGFDGLLIEGWNEGWEDWFGAQKDYVFDFVTPYPDFDLPLINHYHYAVVEAAKHHIMVNAHEAVRPTGLCRTWPNMIGNESAMGTEFRMDINPGHTSILPFTRLQGGPMDYTPGIFEQDMSVTAPGQTGKMRHTIGNQLGLYVTFYSPLQMAADLPQNYARFMDAFQFIKDVAVDWDRSIYLMAEPGEYIVTARHPNYKTLNSGRLKGTSGAYEFAHPGGVEKDVWFVGGITGENAKEVEIPLDFLKKGVVYEATLYADAPDADYETNPQAYEISRHLLSADSTLKVQMARSGGFGLSLREK